ncbi:MAG: hypothetical protein JW910_06360 [Anaerolineae bacterium]|nr:hypothetical protein [Anaerolineae bacterium]
MALERIGHELIAKNARQFITDMRNSQQASENFQRSLAKGAGSKADLAPKGVLDRLRGFLSSARDASGGAGQFGSALTAAGAKAAIFAAAAGVALVAVKKIAGALWDLGKRGAAVSGVVQAFDAITAGAGIVSRTLLSDLRQAAMGTVADFDLMRLTNLALAGATGQVAQEIGLKLPKLLEIARVQAKATGQSVDYLFDSLVTGVKRSSPMLIDNTGLVLKIGAANEALAKSLGKTAEALTDDEKKIAILNATLEAGQRALDAYGSKTKSAADLLAGLGVRVQNLKDRFAVALQPAFTLILQFADVVLAGIIWPLEKLVIPLFYELSKAIFGPLSRAFEQFRAMASSALQPFFDWLRAWLPPIIALLRLLGAVLNWILQQALSVLGFILKGLRAFLTVFFGDLDPQRFFEGGARAIGALAKGILHAANTYVFPVIIAMAQFIADFLCGFSPPKKGPLSTIDKGGAGTMLAWLEGFTGVSLDPISRVTADVDAMLGSIGALTHDQVEKRLAQLDLAIRPFEERLAIVKSRMDAILEPLKAIKDYTEKQLGKALEKFTKGDLSAEAVRAYDRQLEALDGQVEGVEDMTGAAEYQLMLMKLRQAQERALLEIQLKRTEGAEAETEATKEAAEKAAKAATGAAEIPETPGAGITPLPGAGDPLAEFLGISEDDVAKSMRGIKGAFMEGFGPEGMAEWGAFQEHLGTLRGHLGRIASADPVGKITKKFSGLVGGVLKPFQEIKDKIGGLWDEVFGDGGIVNDVSMAGLEGAVTGVIGAGGTVRSAFEGFQTWLPSVWDTSFGPEGLVNNPSFENLVATVSAMFGLNEGGGVRALLQGFFDWFGGAWETAFGAAAPVNNLLLDSLTNTIDKVFGEGSAESIRTKIDGALTWLKDKFIALPAEVPGWLDGLTDSLTTAFETPIRNKVQAVIDFLFGGESGAETLKGKILFLPTAIMGWLLGLSGSLSLSFLTPFTDKVRDVIQALTGDLPGSLYHALVNLPASIIAWLTGLAEALRESLLRPFETVIEVILGGVDAIGKKLAELAQPGGVLEDLYEGARDLYEGTIGRLPGMAGGGRPRPGQWYVVGEEGPELFRTPVRGEVYSHHKSAAMLAAMSRPVVDIGAGLRRLMAGPQPQGRAVGGATINNQSSQSRSLTVNFNSRDTRQNLNMKLSVAKAWL